MDPLIGRVILERYEILQRIGSGGMGAVYVGRQQAVDRRVALKVLRSDLMSNEHVRQRFRREAEIIARLKHPHTIQLIDYGETPEGLAVMVMELLEGQSLSERLKGEGPLTLMETVRYGQQVAASLAEAHLFGLVHRDLKPANIFLTEVGHATHAKVLDFGIARLLDEEATRLTSTGQVFGTPRYMSPEQATSTGDVDARSDLYSLGLILYECVVGQPPFVAQTSIQYLSAHTTQTPPRLRERCPEAPVALEALIDACLAKDADERPSTAEEMQRHLAAIERALADPSLDPAPILVRPPDMPAASAPTVPATRPPAPAKARWTRLVLAAGLVLVVSVLAGLWWAGRRAEPADVEVVGLTGTEPEPDALALTEPSPDAGAVQAASEVPDAGFEEVPDPPDAGVVDAGRPPRRKPRRRRPQKRTPPESPSGIITGPRTMTIPIDED